MVFVVFFEESGKPFFATSSLNNSAVADFSASSISW